MSLPQLSIDSPRGSQQALLMMRAGQRVSIEAMNCIIKDFQVVSDNDEDDHVVKNAVLNFQKHTDQL